MLRRLVQICDYFFLCTSKLSQARCELELSVLFIIIWNLRMIYWRWDLIATYSRAFHRNASSVLWGITHIKRGHGTPEDEGEGWGTEDAGITVRGKSWPQPFPLKRTRIFHDHPENYPFLTFPYRLYRYLNQLCMKKSLCWFVCRWRDTYIKFVPLNVIRLQRWK